MGSKFSIITFLWPNRFKVISLAKVEDNFTLWIVENQPEIFGLVMVAIAELPFQNPS